MQRASRDSDQAVTVLAGLHMLAIRTRKRFATYFRWLARAGFLKVRRTALDAWELSMHMQISRTRKSHRLTNVVGRSASLQEVEKSSL